MTFTQAELSSIGLVATDLDGTLTKNGKFTSELLIALESLKQHHIPVLIVTGRSAGWVSAIANYLPIMGAIAENGGLFYHNQNGTTEIISELGELDSHRLKLKEVFELLQSKFPEIQESVDNPFRWTDWTFDLGDLTPDQLQEMEDFCQNVGYGFTYSTVQCHIKPKQQNKASALRWVINQYFSDLSLSQVVTVGDSPNDEPLFNPNYFPVSVGVANIQAYSDRLKYQPTYVTSLSEVAGFCQLAKLLIAKT